MSLTLLTIFMFISIVISIAITGFKVYYLLAIIPSILFACRKLGLIIKSSNLILLESILFFIYHAVSLALRHDSLKVFIATAIFMAFRILLYVYDNKVFIYIEEDDK